MKKSFKWVKEDPIVDNEGRVRRGYGLQLQESNSNYMYVTESMDIPPIFYLHTGGTGTEPKHAIGRYSDIGRAMVIGLTKVEGKQYGGK